MVFLKNTTNEDDLGFDFTKTRTAFLLRSVMDNPKRWPFRQDDIEWKDIVMWDRNKVIGYHMLGNNKSYEEASELLHEFDDGNTIGNEGCLITSLAMVLHLLDESEGENSWTPERLNTKAQKLGYYTTAGLSMATLYADIVSEVTKGEVQMCAKEEYLSGEKSWPPIYASSSWLVRAYRQLPDSDRHNFAVMIKTGTYDDTIASHYLLLDPDNPGNFDEDNVYVLDPAMPSNKVRPWSLSNSAKTITKDKDIKKEWKEKDIKPLQIAGVWLFARWRTQNDRLLLEPFADIWASELKAKL